MQKSQPSSEQKISTRATGGQRVLCGLLCAATVAFWCLCFLAARGRFDLGRMLGLCGFKQRYGLPCPGCGMTTATLLFAQGRILKSFYVQPAAALGCLVLAGAAFFSFIIAASGIYFGFLKRFLASVRIGYLILGFVTVILAAWAVTMARAMAQG